MSNEDWRPGQRGDAPDQDSDWHRKLLDGSLQGILVIDRDDHVVYVNQAICNILGYDNADDMLVLAKSSILIAAEDRTRLGRYRDDRLAGRTAPNTYRYRGRRRDGELVWLTNLCRSITLHGQEVVQNSITDISKQVKAEDDLRRSEQRYRDLFESTILGILIFDGQGRPLLVNQATATLFGYDKPEQIVELASIAPLSADPDPKQRLDYQTQRLRGGVLADRFELRGRRRDGTSIWLQGHVQVVEWEGAPAIQATLIDIGEQKRMQAALQAVDAQLQQSQRLEMVGQLTGGVAHDFNNLLAVIAGNAEMLGEAVAGEPELSDFCRRVLMATKRGAELTHRLLAYSRRQALNPRQTDLNALVNDMGELLRRTLGEAVTVRIDSEDGLWECEIDPVQMENVLLNLAINARDAMANGGDLTIATRNRSITEAEVPGVEEGVEELIPGDYVVTTVTDNGEGMSDDILDKVYEPFFTTKDIGQGSGLGLSMTYGFMRQSGGQVTIESEVGSGTVVRLYLPRMGGGQSRSNVEDGFETIPRGRGETVLVVEDDDDVRTLACAQLISLGYRVVEAQNGAEALDKMAAEESFDVVLCDMVMPGGFSGPDMLERTRRGGGGTPFIFMSGYPGQKVPEAVDGERGPPLLAKPFRMVDLARALRSMLDGGAA